MGSTTPLLVTGALAFAGVAATCLTCVGVERLREALRDLDRRILDATPYLGLIVGALLFKRATHDTSLAVSRAIDWNITDAIYATEGAFVAHLQAAVPSEFYPFFAAVYMIGFPYLLLAPAVAYFLATSLRRLKELLVAYVLNYVGGVTCYTLFVAYGPRLWLDGTVEEPMYELYPETQDVTAAVSANTNVFPSLHTSLAVVVLLFAWRSRREYPRWFPVAAVGSTSVVLSTMVLGIHWFADVVAGIGLALASAWLAVRIVRRVEGAEDPEHRGSGDVDGTGRPRAGD